MTSTATCVPDFIVGAPGDDTNGIDAGNAQVVSGATGIVLRTWRGAAAGDTFGAAVSGAGDVNGDGHADVIIGAPGDSTGGVSAGKAFVMSGDDGSILHTFTGAAGDSLGSSVGDAGQVDLDGYADVIVGAPGGDYAQVFSGVDGSTLFTATSPTTGISFGASVDGVGDTDGDDRSDVAIGAPGDDGGGIDAGLVLLVSGSTGATLHTFLGDLAGDAMGTAVSGAGDVNNDGIPDVIAGAPGADNSGADSGSARVFSGTGSTITTFDGDFAGDAFGSAVSGAGDLNGDGFSDLVAGAPGNDWGGVDAGAARTFSGSDGAILGTWRGDADADDFGSAVAVLGDANDDGYADVLTGAPGADNNGSDSGSASVFARKPYNGLALTTTHTPAGSPALFGFANQFVGDWNNDGVGDYAVGARAENLNGTIRVFSGADQSILSTIDGGAPSIFFGTPIGRAGDVNQDGFDDILTGAQHYTVSTSFEGRATLRSGKDDSIIWQWFGVASGEHMGSALGGLGDIDGDMVPDVFVGLLKSNNGAGSVRTYSGATGLQIWEVTPNQPGDWFGNGGEQVGDLNGDGITDFVVGASQAATLPARPGYAVVLSGVNGLVLHRWDGLSFGDLFGSASASAGDVNGDGFQDVVVGAKRHDPQGRIDAGMARVFSGADGSMLYHYDGEVAGDSFGAVVNGLGDIDGDGFDDFVVAAPGHAAGGVIAAGRAYLYSGMDGSLLQTIDGTIILAVLGGGTTGIGDVNGDGYADVSVGSTGDPTNGPQSGAVFVYESQVKSDPGAFCTYGAACEGSNGRLPKVAFAGQPVLGGNFDISVDRGPATTLAVIGFDSAQQNTSLVFLSAPECTLLALPVISFNLATGTDGKASLTLPVPNVASLIDANLYVQWIMRDLASNPLTFIFSDGGRITFGAP